MPVAFRQVSGQFPKLGFTFWETERKAGIVQPSDETLPRWRHWWGGPGPVWLLVAAGLVALALRPLYRPDATPERLVGTAQIIDGDSLRINGRELRLKDIDAPESRQTCIRDAKDWPCGQAASDHLREMTWRREVTCRIVGIDRYNRGLAFCTVEGRAINASMVRDGMAVAFGGFAREEADARKARRGIWAGTFERPQDWRRKHPRGSGG